MPKGRNKYGARRIQHNGRWFDSQRELKVWLELQWLQKAGDISNLELKPVFKFSVDGRPVLIRSERYKNGRQAQFVPDFSYFDKRRNCRILCDAKGVMTESYKLRKALVECMYPGTIVEER